MPGMRRRLRGLTSRVVGAAPSTPDEPTSEPAAPVADSAAGAVEAPISDTGRVPDLMDPRLRDAVDLARAVAVEVAGDSVGDHLGVETEDDLVVSHLFASTDKAYVGWRWTVTVARAEGTDEVTVDEVVLLPGEGSLVAPAWVPWSERVQPGDLSPGDLLPPVKDDPRLVPAYTDTSDEVAAEAFWELGLGRPRVLGLEGRLDAADRWYDGEQGPFTAMARQAPGQCLDCGFRLPLAGGLSALFGVCANAFAPDDGKVVAMDHGCGAHSETAVDSATATAGLVVEHEELEELELVVATPEDETPDGHAS
ncbi:MAG: hypothetical protein JWO22_304 [Frankiales bacterium]|nr:hypothetical protein [Frankiales bacterium]